MKEITLNNQNYLLVELPSDATDIHEIYINDVGCIRYTIGHMSSVIEPVQIGEYLEKNKHQLIGKISEILKDEEICKGLVEHKKLTDTIFLFCSYTSKNPCHLKATDSFKSYLESINLEMSKQYLLIKKL